MRREKFEESKNSSEKGPVQDIETETSEPIAHRIMLSQTQIERFEKRAVQGTLVIAVVKPGDFLLEDALGGVFHYIADDHESVIMRARAVSDFVRYRASISDDSAAKARLEATAQSYDFEDLGASIPRSRIVDVD